MLISSHQETMTSREIADLVESRHDKVKQSIDRLVTRGVISQPPLGDGEKSGNGTVEQVYLIGKRDSYIIVAQLSPEFTARLVDRWSQLENGTTPKELTRMEILEIAMQSERENIQLRAEIAAAAPAVNFVGRYVNSTGLQGFREVAKMLKIKEPVFRAFLKDNAIMYKLAGEWVPFAQHLDAGRFEVKAGTAEANGHAYNSARFTPKGVAWIAGLLAVHNLPK